MGNAAPSVAHLAALVAVADEGGIGRAARRLGLAQSAVSQRVAALERSTGLILVARRPGPAGSTLTPEGLVLAAHARAVLDRLRAFAADAARLRQAGRARVRLGTFMSAGARILPAVLAALAAEADPIDLEVVERDSDDDLIDEVLRCELDLAFAILPAPAVASRALLADPHVLLLPGAAPLARRRRPVTLAELAALPLIGFRDGASEERRVEGVFREAGLEPRIVFRTDNNLAIPELVAVDIGFAVLPRLALPAIRPDLALRVLPIPEATLPARRIGLCWHPDRTLGPAAGHVVELTAALSVPTRLVS